MRITQTRWTRSAGWSVPLESQPSPQLVLVFGSRQALASGSAIADVHSAFPNAEIVGCSTAGEICGTEVLDDSIVCTTLRFAHTCVRSAQVQLAGSQDTTGAATRLARLLPPEVPDASKQVQPLRHVLVFSDGLHVNGSDLVRGLAKALPPAVTLTGGLAGDGADFKETLVVSGAEVRSAGITAIGFYGSRLRVGFGSLGGWDSFGPDRLITRSSGNVLYELDGQSALGLYKKYLGEHAAGLPATGLLFPLSLRTHAGADPVVRTILAVDEEQQSLTFAGDVPERSYARLMKANFDRLIDGAVGAAQTGFAAIGGTRPDFALLISCVGRKLVLRQRVEEEVEGVRDILGPEAVLAGFYSYGEISPLTPGARCELHNQTMTITTFTEA
jgi:hypothetical protein